VITPNKRTYTKTFTDPTEFCRAIGGEPIGNTCEIRLTKTTVDLPLIPEEVTCTIEEYQVPNIPFRRPPGRLYDIFRVTDYQMTDYYAHCKYGPYSISISIKGNRTNGKQHTIDIVSDDTVVSGKYVTSSQRRAVKSLMFNIVGD